MSFAASRAQREKVRDLACIVCGDGPCDPMHLASRAQGGCDNPLCVVPGCRRCHRAFDTGTLDLLVFLEPHHRAEMAHALLHLGLVGLYRRLTGKRDDNWRGERAA